MKIENNSITTKQFYTLTIISGMVIKMFMLPSLLLKVSGSDSVFVMLFYLVLELINISCITLLIRKYPDKTFFDHLKDCVGNVGSKIMIGIMILGIMLKMMLNITEVKLFFSTSLYEEISWGIMLVPLLLLFISIASKSLRTLGRVSELILPFLILSITLLAFIMFKDINVANILPFFDEGIMATVRGINEFPLWFGDAATLLICMGSTKPKKHFIKITLFARLAVAMIIMVFTIVIFATYKNLAQLIDYGHNVSALTQYNLGSQEFGRFDLIIYSIWLMGIFLNMALNFYFIVRCIAYIIGKKAHRKIGVGCAICCYILSMFVFTQLSVTYDLSVAWLKYLFVYAEYVIPTLLFVMVTIKNRKNTKNSKNKVLSGDENEQKTA